MEVVPTNAILTTEEVARLLRCSEKTVEERVRRGDLPGLHFGDGGSVFPTDALLKRLNELALNEAAKKQKPIATPTAVAFAPPATRQKKPPVALPPLPQPIRQVRTA
jgi:excisionase family DNA binding protein